MAESTSLVAVHREILVVEHQLAEQLDLLNLVIRRRREPLQCLRLDTVDFGFHLSDFRESGSRQRRVALIRLGHIGSHSDNNGAES